MFPVIVLSLELYKLYKHLFCFTVTEFLYISIVIFLSLSRTFLSDIIKSKPTSVSLTEFDRVKILSSFRELLLAKGRKSTFGSFKFMKLLLLFSPLSHFTEILLFIFKKKKKFPSRVTVTVKFSELRVTWFPSQFVNSLHRSVRPDPLPVRFFLLSYTFQKPNPSYTKRIPYRSGHTVLSRSNPFCHLFVLSLTFSLLPPSVPGLVTLDVNR